MSLDLHHPENVRFCKCGCGLTTRTATRTRAERGWVKGEPQEFIYGHSLRDPNKQIEDMGIGVNAKGYSYTTGGTLVHRINAERVLGKTLPSRAAVHHIDENRQNPNNNNLVICQDNTYHQLLHQRMRALKSSGHAGWRKCYICKKHDDPARMVNYESHPSYFHRECSREKAKRQYREMKNAA